MGGAAERARPSRARARAVAVTVGGARAPPPLSAPRPHTAPTEPPSPPPQPLGATPKPPPSPLPRPPSFPASPLRVPLAFPRLLRGQAGARLCARPPRLGRTLFLNYYYYFLFISLYICSTCGEFRPLSLGEGVSGGGARRSPASHVLLRKMEKSLGLARRDPRPAKKTQFLQKSAT